MNNIPAYSLDDITFIYNNEFRLHHQAETIDYYKLFFQAYHGQGHFVGSKESVQAYLEQELNEMQAEYLPLVQDIGNETGLYRISLTVLQKKLISINEFIDMFCAVESHNVDWIKWQHEWTVIESILLNSDGMKPDERQSEICRTAIEKNELISHSQTFRLTYHPHYRVMQLNHNDELLNRLQNAQN